MQKAVTCAHTQSLLNTAEVSTRPSLFLHLTAAVFHSLVFMPVSGSFSSMSHFIFLIFVLSLSLLSCSFFHIAAFLFSVSSFSCFIFLSSVSHRAHDYLILVLIFALTFFFHSFFCNILIFYHSCLSHLSFSALISAWTLFNLSLVPCSSLSHISFNFVFWLITFSSLCHISLITLCLINLCIIYFLPLSLSHLDFLYIFPICFFLLYAVSFSFLSPPDFSLILFFFLSQNFLICLNSVSFFLSLSHISFNFVFCLITFSSRSHISLIITSNLSH